MNTVDSALMDNKSKADKRANSDHKKAAEAYINQARKFEEDRVQLAHQSRKNAWIFSGVSAFISILLAISIIVMMPLKTVDYRLLTVNQDTGMTEIVQPMADAEFTTYGEVLDKYWINKYIIERGNYDWETVQNAYNYMEKLSSAKVFSAYNTYIRSKTSPVEVFGDTKTVKLSNISISFLPTSNEDHMLAQVTFTKTVYNNDGSPSVEFKPTIWNSTISFDYQKDVKKEEERLVNPLGFRVTSYREDRVLR